MAWLGRDSRVQRIDLRVGGPLVDAAEVRGRPCRPRPEDQAGLEQREVPRAAAQIAQRGGEQAGQQSGAQLRFSVRQRIHHMQGVAPRVVGRQSEQVGYVIGHERVAQHLDVAGRGERPGHRAPLLLMQR